MQRTCQKRYAKLGWKTVGSNIRSVLRPIAVGEHTRKSRRHWPGFLKEAQSQLFDSRRQLQFVG
jgi:hypothetical protein